MELNFIFLTNILSYIKNRYSLVPVYLLFAFLSYTFIITFQCYDFRLKASFSTKKKQYLFLLRLTVDLFGAATFEVEWLNFWNGKVFAEERAVNASARGREDHVDRIPC